MTQPFHTPPTSQLTFKKNLKKSGPHAILASTLLVCQNEKNMHSLHKVLINPAFARALGITTNLRRRKYAHTIPALTLLLRVRAKFSLHIV